MKIKPSILPKLAINRPVTILVSLLAIIVIGAIAYTKIPIELMPTGIKDKYLGVWVPYPNANPQEVEEQIARPIEEQVRTISGIKRVETHSNPDGCWCWLEFNPSTDMDVAYDQLRDRLERARAMLPDDFDRYWLRRFGPDNIPIIFLTLALPDHIDDPHFIVDRYIKRPIERIDGVGSIDIWGAEQKSIQIMIDQDKVKAHRLNMYQVTNELQQDNFALSSGWVYEGDKKFIVRSVARFQSVEDVRNLPVNNLGITVGDIAEVTYDIRKRTWHQRVNGKTGVLVGIQKESLANTVDLSRQLKEILNHEIATNPNLADVEVDLLFVQGDWIEDAIANLQDTMLWGGVFALFILMFFLRNIRMTIIMMFAIPLSILISLIVIYFMGWTLNLVVMMGLMISIGMVIDNGIVVLENIYHKRNDGANAKDASLFGASEVNLAIILATLTTVVVFLPMLFMLDDGDGQFSFYMQRIGLPVIFSLLASLLVALVLIPLATSKFSTEKLAKEHKALTYAKEKYDRLLNWSLNHRLDVSIGAIIILILTFQVLPEFIPRVDESGGDISDVRMRFELPRHLTAEEVNDYFTQVEDTIFAHAEKYNLRAVDTGFRPGFGRINMYFNQVETTQWYHTVYYAAQDLVGIERDTVMSKEAVLEDVKKRLPEKPGVRMFTSWRGGSDDAGQVRIVLSGDDTGKLAELATEVERRMSKLEGVVSVETSQESGADEIKISMDREVVSRNGINSDQVAYTLMYAVRGITLPRFQAHEKEIDMRIQLQEEDRENLQQLKNITFMNNQGRAVPLSAIADFSIQPGFGQISRIDGKTSLSVVAQTTMKDLNRISQQIDAQMQGFDLPYGYSWRKGDRFHRFSQQDDTGQKAMLMAVVLVYLLMAVLFESFTLPLSILLAIPMAFFGSNLILAITQTGQDIMALIGLVILVGVVVNNGIVLVDMINRRRKEGLARHHAILDAGKNRFRPIMMTSFTTIAGLVPMALGSAGLFGIPYAPMGRVIIGGMLTSTVLTLVIVPVFYTVFDDLAVFMRRLVIWFRGGSESAQDVSTSTS